MRGSRTPERKVWAMYWRSDEWIMTSFSFLHVNLQATMSRRGKWAKISIKISVEKVRKGGSM
jgi:hypothetical protein